MKKFLALVLALVMTMSLVTISSSAEFSDADSIKYDEAVNVLVGLGVIEGMGDGTYAPEGNVTRAQMAKMITFIKLGVAEASAFEGTKTDLTDIDGHWAEAYIKFCYSQGIIAGKGNGKFDPDANVTTAEAAKMLLVALGWNAKVQGYVGEEWQVNTIRDAFTSKVFEGINLGAEKQVNRDEAAKLVYNTILANMVEKVSEMDRVEGVIVDGWQQIGTNLLFETFKAYKFNGVMEDISYNPSNGEYTYSDNNDVGPVTTTGYNGFIATNKYGDVLDTADAFRTTEDYTGYLFEEVSVIAKATSTGHEVLSIFPTGATKTMTVALSALGSVSGKLKVDGVKYAVENSCVSRAGSELAWGEILTVDNDAGGETGAAELQDKVVDSQTQHRYDLVKIVDMDCDGKYDTVYQYGLQAAKVVYVSEKEIITNNGDTFTFADDEIASGIAKDDYVYSYKQINGVNVVAKIDPIESVASAVKYPQNHVQFDGVWYHDGDAASVPAATTLHTAGATYRAWILNGIVVASKQLSGFDIEDLVLVYAKGGAWDNEAKYIGVDGKKEVVVVDGSNSAGTAIPVGAMNPAGRRGELYLINKTDDGVEFVNPIDVGGNKYHANGVVSSQVRYNNGPEIDHIDTYRIANDAVILVYANDGVAVISGAQLQSLLPGVGAGEVIDTTAIGYYVHNSATELLHRVTYAGVRWNASINDLHATSGKEVYAYITSDAVQIDVNGSKCAQYTIWNGTENLTVIDRDDNYYRKGHLIRYDTVDENGFIHGVTNFDVAGRAYDAAAYGQESGRLYFADTNDQYTLESYKITGDTKYLYVNSNAANADEIGKAAGELRTADTYADGNLIMDNVALVVAANGSDYELIVIDVANNMTRSNTSSVGNVNNKVLVGVNVDTRPFTDTTSVKEGDAIHFDFGVVPATRTVRVYNVLTALGQVTDGNYVDVAGGSVITLFAVGEGAAVTVDIF